ncbi:unnamed protein product [Effrenium voratum]|uniref:PUM-HD domain-containing protein n=1 Tax=Effrenium voratum TaxID=2562239 RepID=A0AA36IVM2_9DINO|nr:unnamed protein product [Effrenium voratum]
MQMHQNQLNCPKMRQMNQQMPQMQMNQMSFVEVQAPLPQMPGQQCVIAMFLAGPQHMHQLPCMMGNKVSPMPGTPCTGTPSTSDDEVQDEPTEPEVTLTTSAARRLRRQRAAQRAAQNSTGAGWWAAGPVAAGLVCNPVSDFFAQHSEQKLQEQLRGDQQEVTAALEVLKGHVWDLSCHPTGCRLVQLALENAKQRQASELGSELKGHVQEAMASPHANYVVQKILTQLLWNSCSFVAEEFQGSAAALSQHRFGCRAFCRLLEFHAQQEGTLLLVDEILQESVELCCHPFGHHVVQSILEHGLVEHRDRVALAIAANDTLGLATDQNASYLVEKAVCSSSPRYQEALLKEPSAIPRSPGHVPLWMLRGKGAGGSSHDPPGLRSAGDQKLPARAQKDEEHGLLLLLDLGLMQRKSK